MTEIQSTGCDLRVGILSDGQREAFTQVSTVIRDPDSPVFVFAIFNKHFDLVIQCGSWAPAIASAFI